MNKIVYNACYGGYGLSEAAMERIAELKGIEVYKKEIFRGCYSYYADADFSVPFPYFERHDKALVQTVEELGKAAGGEYSNLQVYQTESNRYFIDEYDGYETVQVEYDEQWTYI